MVRPFALGWKDDWADVRDQVGEGALTKCRDRLEKKWEGIGKEKGEEERTVREDDGTELNTLTPDPPPLLSPTHHTLFSHTHTHTHTQKQN